jgi:hypothetical protein
MNVQLPGAHYKVRITARTDAKNLGFLLKKEQNSPFTAKVVPITECTYKKAEVRTTDFGFAEG